MIRKEGSAVFQYLQSLIAAREQVRLKSDESGVVGFFLFNCYSCLNGSACSSMFGLSPPELEVYIPQNVDYSEVDDSDRSLPKEPAIASERFT